MQNRRVPKQDNAYIMYEQYLYKIFSKESLFSERKNHMISELQSTSFHNIEAGTR